MDLFKLISKIELITEDGESTLGVIQDKADDKVYVSLIVDDKKFKILHPQDKVKGIITDDDKVLGFNGEVISRISGELPMYEILCKNLEKIQRREDYRLDCNIPAIYTRNDFLLNLSDKHFDLKDVIHTFSEHFNKGILLDVSAGGAKLSTNEKLEDDTKILLIFKFVDEVLMLKGELVYRSKNTALTGLKYKYGVKFTNITDKKRETIVKNIFTLLRKIKQK